MQTHAPSPTPPRYYILAGVSGLAWGALARAVHGSGPRPELLVALLAGPPLGLVAARLYRSAYGRSFLAQAGRSLLSLYVTAALWGLVVGLADRIPGTPGLRAGGEVVYESVVSTLFGLTFFGYVLWMWPLAAANHLLLGRMAGVGSVPGVDGEAGGETTGGAPEDDPGS